jgi:SAM-dependent methyltransferase
MARYIFDQSTWEREAERLDALERCGDPLTLEHLRRTGVGDGWECLEVGAGRGSIARWLADRVGERGRVLAVDLDTTLLEEHRRPNLEVRRLDVLTDPLPAAAFDLVHARHVIGHLPDRASALRRLAAALRPGGWMLVEDFDFRWAELGDWPCDPVDAGPVLGRVWGATLEVMRTGSYDGGWSWRAPAGLRAAGLAEVAGEARAPIGDGAFTQMIHLSVLRFRDDVIARGMAAADVDRCLEVLGDPGSCLTAAPLVSVWGRRPPPPDPDRQRATRSAATNHS